ncbi:peptidoglycan endopeptidase [Altererythrobacter soli]|uniref:Peptidoglycan endopeptidase n=1 Tax=Croceibacterium soli TaxID=1739690 RepID=A0A6I4UNS3_9SPHN|nr:NlpC/P60 family protein [Croceibacterium soli]MXP40056.1 peptidoglycan endopeptidase [Croceibacterium soli]
MSEAARAFAAAAEGLVGTPFRFRGRDAATGLDCVGLVAAALRAAGRTVPAVPAYSMRQRDFGAQLGSAVLAGFLEAGGAAEAGDLLLVRAGPGQVHLLVVGTGCKLIHAHAGLGRVVATPPPCPWPIERHWRLE